MKEALPVILLLLAAAFAVFLWVRLPRLVGGRSGRIVLLMALLVMPLVLMPVGVSQTLHQSKQKDFCMSCHEMQVYDTSLQIDDPEYIPAYHYQNRLVPQATACYTCHTDYTMYGDVSAKMNGMKHLGCTTSGTCRAPGKIELYSPYPNDNCLQCHRGGRRFEKKASHTTAGVTLDLLYSNQKSCVSSGCHDKIHEISELGSVDLWGPPAFPIPDSAQEGRARRRPRKTRSAPRTQFADEPVAEGRPKPARPRPRARRRRSLRAVRRRPPPARELKNAAPRRRPVRGPAAGDDAGAGARSEMQRARRSTHVRSLQWLRIAIVLLFIGIVCELIALLDLTPPTFLAFAFVGIPCMLLGMLIYVVHVWRQLRKKDAL